ncbi:MAG TPA: response regulator transcription factor [Candidatus Dormibacteraeota bacterium]|nr:response regulator transcription factor [Candidatus Dormibacteraeota bacterium]
MIGERGRVLIVEDAAASAELMAALVEREGFVPVVSHSAKDARAAFKRHSPVAVLLDWVLPDSPGTELCRELRGADSVVTIIFVSGRNDETSIARGLDAGADDFVPKPVREGELVARLEAQLRKVARLHAGVPAEPPREERRLKFGEIELDLKARQVRVSGELVQLGPLQYKLLEYLARNAGVAVSRDQILNEVYGIAADIGTDRVDVLVQRLRRKLGDYPGKGGHIIAHPGFGYLLERGPRASTG